MIEVNGIRVQAFHGCLQEEGVIGGTYRVDVAVEGDFAEAETSDRLTATVDYGRVAAIVRREMAQRSSLIEHACSRILNALRGQWPAGYQWTVRVAKEHPPIHGSVDEAVYTLRG